MTELRIGTSAFVASGWQGSFYPAGMKPPDFLNYYATRFDTVEVDSTFYHAPSASTVTGWARKTPDNFVFALKIPHSITHQKVLIDCDDEFKSFVSTAELLGPKLGPMLFQFGYFNRSVFTSRAQFIARLTPFLRKLPTAHKFAIEIRNKYWLTAGFFKLLREHNVAYALTDQSWMPGVDDIFARVDPITADFTYIRWLGDRKGIERVTKVWNRIVVDRTAEMTSWVDVCTKIQRRGVSIEELSAAVEQKAKRWPEVLRLMTHPGVGPLTALAFVLIIGTPERFPCGKQIGSYVGLIPEEDSSAGHQRLGHITKQGSSLLRFLLVEAAQAAARCDADWRRRYMHLALRRQRNIAKVAMARRLAVRLYWMWRNGWKYSEWVKFGSHAGQFGTGHGVN